MDIAVIGLGLIGGSLAGAIKKNTSHRVFAADINRDTINAAKERGYIDSEISDMSALSGMDVTYVCLYPGAAIDFVRENAALFKKGGVVTDVCGIKSEICSALGKVAEENGFHFVGSHPMAGSERSGFAASRDDLFDGASYIITPLDENDPAVKVLSDLALGMGFGGTVISSPERHDEIIALTSQLPHIISCAYVLDADTPYHRGFSGGSFRDMSRVADINDRLWSELFIKNRDALSAKIDALMINLQRLGDAVSSSDYDTLGRLLRTARKMKEAADK